MRQFAALVVQLLVVALWGLILARVLSSWVDPAGRSSIGRVIVGMTEPILAPIRRVLPQAGTFDLAPLIVLLVLGALLRVVI